MRKRQGRSEEEKGQKSGRDRAEVRKRKGRSEKETGQK